MIALNFIATSGVNTMKHRNETRVPVEKTTKAPNVSMAYLVDNPFGCLFQASVTNPVEKENLSAAGTQPTTVGCIR